MSAEVINLKLDSGVSLPSESVLRVAVEVRLPAQLQSPPIAWVCLPGGGMNRGFFDLVSSDGDESFSFSRQMAARGFIVVLVDHLGIGESDRPGDGYALTPELVMQANARAVAQVLGDLREGRVAGCPALPALQSIGVGHSMGAMMTVLQQATHPQHAAVALLGFSTRGLAEFLKPEVRELALDHTAVRAALPRLAREMFSVPYPRITRGPRGNDLYGSGDADPRGVVALKSAMEPLLPLPCFMSMLPGNVLPEAAKLDVPMFLGVGERDMVGPPHEVPLSFTGSPDVTLHILPQTGHSHFLFPARTALIDRMAGWARSIVGGEAHRALSS